LLSIPKAVVTGKQLKKLVLLLSHFSANFSVDDHTLLPLTATSSQLHGYKAYGIISYSEKTHHKVPTKLTMHIYPI